MSADTSIKCYCRECKRETNHKILFARTVTADDDSDYYWRQDYMVVECLGCNCIAYCNSIVDETNTVYDEMMGGEYIPTVYRVVPDPVKTVGSIDIYKLPWELQGIYKETISCINSDNRILAGVGCRAVLEAICRQEEIDGVNLTEMIENMAREGIISKNDRNHLHAIRFLGNDAIHDGEPCEINELVIAANILNNTLTSLYLIPKEFKKLRRKPVTSYEEFLKVLNKSLDSFHNGERGNLRTFINEVRAIVGEDKERFESKLIEDINNGSYTRLALEPSVEGSSVQRYRVCQPAADNHFNNQQS